MRNEVLEKYADIIFKAENRSYTIKKDIEIFKAKILLRDGSTLRVSEKWIDEMLAKYSYYWLDEENKLIIGWDNAPHHKELTTFPHHKHVGMKALSSSEVTLEHVLEAIRRFET